MLVVGNVVSLVADTTLLRWSYVDNNREKLGFEDNDVIQVGCVLTGDILVLEVPGFVETLYGHTKGVVPVLAVDGIDGLS